METKKIEKPKGENFSQPNKDEQFKKMYGKLFIFLIISVICFEYWFYIFEVTFKSFTRSNLIISLGNIMLFHFLLVMMLWCLIVTMTTHPGEIPIYWVKELINS